MSDTHTESSLPPEAPPVLHLPPLAKRGRKGSPGVRLQVLAFALTEAEMLNYANVNNIGIGFEEDMRIFNVPSAIRLALPYNSRFRRAAIVYDDDCGGHTYAFVVASNKSQEELEMAKDIKHIKLFGRVLSLDAERLPWWYDVCPPGLGCKHK